MSESAFIKNVFTLGQGFEACYSSGLVGPSLIILYSAIDIVGWLNSERHEATRVDFIKWANDYLLKAGSLACSAEELYSARCGMLHTFTPNSRDSNAGRARLMIYAWGDPENADAQIADAQTLIDRTDPERFVPVHVWSLYEAWRLGLLAFWEELEKDPSRAARVYEKASQFFGSLQTQDVRDLADLVRRNP